MGKPEAGFAAVLCVCAAIINGVMGVPSFASEPVVPTPLARTTFSGPVTGVRGNLISLGGGLVTIDAASAKIVLMDGDHREVPIASIMAGDFVQGVYGSSPVDPDQPIPAMIVRVEQSAAATFGGYVQQIAKNGITVAGQRAIIDHSTRLGGYQTLRDAQLRRGEVATVRAKAVDGRLVATDVDVRGSYAPDVPSNAITGVVKSIGRDSWIIGFNDGQQTIAVTERTIVEPDARLGNVVTAVFDGKGSAVAIGALHPLGGVVSRVSGHTVWVANGLLPIDVSKAHIDGPRIAPGDRIDVTYAASEAHDGPLPAMYGRIDKPAITLAGPLQAERDDGIVVAGRQIAVTSGTRTSDAVTDPTRAAIGTHLSVTVQAGAGTLVATDICFSRCGTGREIVTPMLHAAVAGMGASSWVLRDAHDHEWTVPVSSATKISGEPQIGAVVDAIVRSSDDGAEVIAVSTAPLAPPQPSLRNTRIALHRGTVKAISESTVRIGSPESRLIVPDYVFHVQPSTPMAGAPREGDVVDVLVSHEGTIAVMRSEQATLPAMTLRGVVTWMQPEAGDISCAKEVKPGWGCGWTIRTAMGIEQMIWTTSKTTRPNAPTVGDSVTAEVIPGPEGYVAQRIEKDGPQR